MITWNDELSTGSIYQFERDRARVKQDNLPVGQKAAIDLEMIRLSSYLKEVHAKHMSIEIPG